MPGPVMVVTDSSAALQPAGAQTSAIMVVPLRVLAGGAVADDAPGGLPDAVARELRRASGSPRPAPAPERFAAAYGAAAAAGAAEIVSVHLSGELSGTVGSARLAAAAAAVPVHVVDSGSIGAGLGIIVAAAAGAAAAAQSGAAVARIAIRRAARIGSFFALDSQEQLRAGGRLGPPAPGPLPAAAPGLRGADAPSPGGARLGGHGSMMRSRPILQVRDGRIVVLERVRTRSAAADRLTELAAGFAAGQRCEVVVQHLDSPAAAASLARQLAAAIPAAGPVGLVTAGTAIWAHTGPGLLGVVVAPLP